MKFSISQSLINKYGNITFALAIINNVKVLGPNAETNKILAMIYAEVIKKYKLETLTSQINSQAYINFANKIDIPPNSAFLPHLQIKRVLNGKSIGNINNIVNEYMALELLYNLSFSAYDLDTIKDNIIAGISKGGEELQVIGGEKSTLPHGDLILSDSAGVFYSFSNGYRNSSKITRKTKNIIFVIDAPDGIEKREVEKCIQQLADKFNSKEILILDKTNPTAEIDSGQARMTNENGKGEPKSQGVKLTHPRGVKAKLQKPKAPIPSVLGVKPLRTLPPKEFVSNEIIQSLYSAVKNCYPDLELKVKDIQLEHPVEESHGDYSSNVAMLLTKELKTNPLEIANKIVEQLNVILGSEATPESIRRAQDKSDSGQARKTKNIISKIEIAGPGFINFWLNDKYLLEKLTEVEKSKDSYGKLSWGIGKKWLIEHTSPNPNKAMHLGHLRNNVTGMAIANIWQNIGIEVVRDCIDNNRGIAIAKLMWGYLKYARKDKKENSDINYWFEHQDEWQTPQDRKLRPDRFVDELYTMGAQDFENNKSTEEAVRQLVVDWENEEPKNRTLWKKVLSYSYEGQKQTLKRLGSFWDKVWHEDEHYKMGKEFVEKGLTLGVFKKTSEGTILTNLSKYKIPDTVVIKSDGTALYITQDLALTKLKREMKLSDGRIFKPDKLHWVIGPEQSLALKQMYAACEQLGTGKLSDFIHIAYGYMSIKGKGKMSSRLGNVLYIDDLLDEAKIRMKKIIDEAQFAKLLAKNDKDEIDKVSEQLGIGAVKYSILKVGRMQDIAFDFDESLSFAGNSGPYLQYTYARAKSVINKNTFPWGAKLQSPLGCKLGCKDDNLLEVEELTILRTLYKFPEVVLNAAQNYAPNLICNYLYDLAQKFNTFYDKLPILKAEDNSREVRLKITEATAQVLHNGLKLLGIETPEKM